MLCLHLQRFREGEVMNIRLRTFIRQFILSHKRQGKACKWVSEFQSILCEDNGAFEDSNRGLKKVISLQRSVI